jgi:hypothetical protein
VRGVMCVKRGVLLAFWSFWISCCLFKNALLKIKGCAFLQQQPYQIIY